MSKENIMGFVKKYTMILVLLLVTAKNAVTKNIQ